MNLRGLLMFLLLAINFQSHAANWLDEMALTKTSIPKPSFSQEHGLIFFYSSQCPYCHQFAPVLKDWSEKNKMAVKALSFDNQGLPEFGTFEPVSTEWINAAFQQSPIQYPALFVVNTQTLTLYPVSFGAMTLDELNQRMASLAPQIISYENKRGAP